MNRSIVREILLYRYRYVAGFLVFSAILIGLLFVRTDLAPTGLSSADMQSAVQSATFKFTQPFTQPLTDFPYLLLQKLSIHTFGLTSFAIVLPSILIAIATGYAFIAMVNRWFRLNVALITSLIFVTSSAFLSAGRSGFGAIMTTWWLSIILLAATNILHPKGKTKTWSIVGIIAATLSLYTPLMIYPLVAIAVAGILHPHIRFTLRELKKWQVPLVIIACVALVAPLVISLTMHPSQIATLLGVPTKSIGVEQLLVHAATVGTTFLNLGGAAVGNIPQPMFGAASLIIIILGFLRTVADRHSARAYMLLIWSALFIPIALLNPDKLLICLVPSYLYMAIGIETLIREWYKLFPNNPYARLAGLMPLTILLGGIMLSNSAQYFYGYFYGTPITQYAQQLDTTRRLVEKEHLAGVPATLVVKSSELQFYDLLRRDYKRLNVTTNQTTAIVRPTIIHDGASYAVGTVGVPKRIVTSYKTKSDQVIERYFTP